MVSGMAEKTTKIGLHTRTLVALATLALVGGCATNPFEDFSNQISLFFKNSGTFENSDTDDPSLNFSDTGGDDPAPPQKKPAQNNDLSHMLERVAETALSNRNYGAAARLYARARDLAPARPGPALGLARASRELGDHRASVRAYRTVLALQPSHPAALREIAREFMDLGAPGDAIPYLKTAVASDPDPRLGNELGIAHDLMGNHDAAQREFRAALALAPGDLTLRTNLGRSLAFSGRYGDAILTLQALVNSPRTTKRQREALALAHAAAGDITAALRVTRIDQPGAVDAGRRARYEMIGELVRQGEPAARADLVAGTVQRDRYAGKIGRSSVEQPTAAAKDASKGPDLLAVLAAIDVRENTVASTASDRDAPKTHSAIPEIATETGPKSLYPTPNAAPTTLNLTPDDPGTPDDMPDAMIDNTLDKNLDNAVLEARPAETMRKVYHVQLAAYHTVSRAEKGWRQLVLKAPEVLDGLDHVIIAPDPKFNAGELLRLRSEACDNRADAKTICDALKDRNLSCLVIESEIAPGAPMPRTRVASARAKLIRNNTLSVATR